MAMYTKWIYPKVDAGNSHKRPSMPLSFVKIHEITVSWDITSTDENNRAEFWEDANGDMTAAEVETAVYGVDGKDAWLILNPPPEDPAV